VNYPFTQEEFNAAVQEWGCNCGPSALAFALQCSLEVARRAIPDFDKRHYASPSMMKAALGDLGVTIRAYPKAALPTGRGDVPSLVLCTKAPALVRVQWGGPWYGRYAYQYTHWICCWRQRERNWVFDCNGGISSYEAWCSEIVPLLIPKRGDGTWFPTHVWRITGAM